MRRRRSLGAAVIALTLVACNAILGLDGDTVVTARDGGAVVPNDGGTDSTTPLDGGHGADGGVIPGDAGLDGTVNVDAGGVITLGAGVLGGPGNANGASDDARFTRLKGIAYDKEGNRYVVDGEDVIRRIGPDGVVSTFAGAHDGEPTRDGIGTNARFLEITGLTSDREHTLYLTQRDCRLRKIDTLLGEVSTLLGIKGCEVAPGPGPVPIGLRGPEGVVFGHGYSSTGPDVSVPMLYISDPPFIRGFDFTSKPTVVCGADVVDLPGTSCTLNRVDARDLVFDKEKTELYFRQAEQIYALDVVKGLLEVRSAAARDAGVASERRVGSGLAIGPAQVLFFASGRELLSAIVAEKAIQLLTGNNIEPAEWRDGEGPKARFESIFALATADGKNIDIADRSSLRRFDGTSVKTIAGRGRVPAQVDGTGGNARFGVADSMTRTKEGLVYFFDRSHGRVRSYDPVTYAVATLDLDGPESDGGALSQKVESMVFDGARLLVSVAPATASDLGRVLEIDRSSRQLKTFTAELSLGRATDSDQNGRVFATANLGTSVISWRPGVNAPVTTLASPFVAVSGLCYDASSENIVVLDQGTQTVKRMAPGSGGAYLVTPIDGTFDNLDKVTCDGKGYAYLNDAVSGVIRRLRIADGTVTTIAGTSNVHGVLLGPLPGRLNQPISPLALPSGHLLVSSAAEAVILDISPPPP